MVMLERLRQAAASAICEVVIDLLVIISRIIISWEGQVGKRGRDSSGAPGNKVSLARSGPRPTINSRYPRDRFRPCSLKHDKCSPPGNA
ncbi:hypothetical protein BDW66DRAFT_22171 [Aspergillus desertorum]